LERTHRLRCRADDPPKCRTQRNLRHGREAPPLNQNIAAQRLSLRWHSAGRAEARDTPIAAHPGEQDPKSIACSGQSCAVGGQHTVAARFQSRPVRLVFPSLCCLSPTSAVIPRTTILWMVDRKFDHGFVALQQLVCHRAEQRLLIKRKGNRRTTGRPRFERPLRRLSAA
jgi:hypothetical protein